MTDLARLAELDDEITGSDQENLDAIEQLLEQRTALLELPIEVPEIEEPPAPEPQVAPKDFDDPLANIRGLTALQIDELMNKGPMLDLIELATGERPPQRTKASELAEQLFQLTQTTNATSPDNDAVVKLEQ